MAFVFKFFKTVRTHWKKSIVFTAIGVYGVKFGIDRYEDDMLRRQYCAEAKVYGDQIAQFGGPNRKITVFLNPAASGTESKKLFEKNAAPILYLAGLEVNVVKTEYDGQIKEFFKLLERKHVDGVVVAGGNGSLLEVVTGMMRKEDKEFRQKVPVGVIPTGKTNKFATFFFGSDKQKVRRMLDSAMAVVKGATQKIDVIKIQGEDGRSTFALCSLEMGGYRDAKEKTSKYWYLGPLKHRFTYLWFTVRSWPPSVRGTLEYMEAKDTDVPKQKEKKEEPQKQQESWMTSLLYMITGSRKPVQIIESGLNESTDRRMRTQLQNTECYKPYQRIATYTNGTTLLMVTFQILACSKLPTTMKGVQMGLGPEEIAKSDFITEGWKRLQDPVWSVGSDANQQTLCRKVKFTPKVKKGTELWYSIDGEQFEALPVEVSLMKNKLNVFTSEDKSPS
ncbi:acylglycerol kinase, mitochondrial-like [Mercenaria mercenaria]|uniref:acylglycerol kinase, mitochondrial-like n=1 Tax=Mercenaria mercenaria TaxID=6596 RepID=UPI00234F01B0|nr:acylglycerol kinase, mitochondrial-like [Mercenaria mercenaria]